MAIFGSYTCYISGLYILRFSSVKWRSSSLSPRLRMCFCGASSPTHVTCWSWNSSQKKSCQHWKQNPSSKQMGVSENSGTPKSSILIGFSTINHPFWGTTIFGNTQILLLGSNISPTKAPLKMMFRTSTGGSHAFVPWVGYVLHLEPQI